MAPKTKKFVVRSAVVCEGLRHEIGRKLTLFGVFSGEIVPDNFPASLMLATYIELSNMPLGKSEVGIRWALNDETLIEGLAEIGVANDGLIGLPIPSMPLNLKSPGRLHFEIKVGSDDWLEVLDRRVLAVEDLPAGTHLDS